MQRDSQYAADVIRACDRISEYLAGVTRAEFDETPLIQDGVIRQILVVGEAAKRFSPEFKEITADIPWTRVTGMRDVLVHGYDGIDLAEVWRTATIDLPALAERLRRGDVPSA